MLSENENICKFKSIRQEIKGVFEMKIQLKLFLNKWKRVEFSWNDFSRKDVEIINDA